MATSANILLSIGSKLGPGGFASLQAGIQMLGALSSSVTNAVKELDRFKLVMDQVDMSMVNMADSAAAGQVDTYALMQALSALNKSAPHLKITADQYAAITARAAEFAASTGQDATAVFGQMTDSLIRGTERGLKPFGIDLENTEDLMKAQKEALEKLTDGYIGFEHTISTNSQRISALSNNWGTFTSALWAATGDIPGVSNVLDALNEALGETASALTTTSKAVNDWVFSFQNAGTAVAFILKLLRGDTTGAGIDFWGLIQRGIQDKDLLAAVEAENKAKADKLAAQTRGGGKGTGGKGTPFTTTEEMEFTSAGGYDEYTYQLLLAGGATEKEAYQAAASAKGAQGFRIGAEGDYLGAEQKYAGDQERVDLLMEEISAQEEKLRIFNDQYYVQQMMDEIQEAELYSMREQEVERSAMLELMDQEEYQEQRLAAMRQDALLASKERILQAQFELEQQVDFASEFKYAWKDAFDGVSAGSLAASGATNLLKQVWSTVVTAAIEGSNSIGEGIRRAVQMVGTQIAIESGLRALEAAAYAVFSLAKREYDAAAEYAASAAQFAAVAVIAGAVAGTASAFGHSVSRVQPARTSSSGGYGSSYSSRNVGSGDKTVTYIFKLDDSAQMFKLVQDENGKASREGSQAFALTG
jgi:hypothetical protein